MGTEELELASTISSSSSQYDDASEGVLEVMSYEDLIAALEDSETQDHDQHQKGYEREGASSTRKIRVLAHASNDDDEAVKEFASSVSLPGIISGHKRHARSAEWRSWSWPMRSIIKPKEGENGTALPISAKLSSLVEFGIHDVLGSPSDSERPSYTHALNNSDSICSFQVSGEESADSPVPSYDGQGGSEVESTETDVPLSYAQYSSRQLALFSDFLQSPFTYTSPATPENAISPYDTKGHLNCDQTLCTRCLLLAFAVSRNPSEPHPAASWLAKIDSDDFGVRWRRMFSAMRGEKAVML